MFENIVDVSNIPLLISVILLLTAVFFIQRQYAKIRRANGELSKARNEALDATKAKSIFLANMSHELRTPLNAIIGYTEMLIEETEENEHIEYTPDLKKIHTAGKHLLQLINDILDLSKVEAHKLELYLETFDVNTMIQDVVTTIQPLAEKNGNTFELHSASDLGAMRADLTRVRQVLFNLLSNACKFTERGTISLDVGQEGKDGRDWLYFSVRDNGIGMTSQQMEKLFQPFSQGDSSTTRKYGGTGLGLAISQRFCQMMGGDITVKSEVGKGSTFTMHLPIEVTDQKTEGARPAKIAESLPMAGANTVLVIDDDPSVHDMLSRSLAKEGFRVKTASDGKEGLRLARELRPDVITLDVLMPNTDGWAILTALKSDPDLASIPVIMLTIIDDKNLGFALGATDYLIKPIEREHLVVTLKKYCKQPPGPILVVEDDLSTREMLCHMLTKEGWAVAEAENGRIALKLISDNQPAAILLDLLMPEMDGFELISKLRAKERWRKVPVIVVTAKDLTQEDRLRLNGNVEKILQKGNYSRRTLLNEIRTSVKASLQHEKTSSKEA